MDCLPGRSSNLVQLDILSAEFSKKAHNSHHVRYFRAFLETVDSSKPKSFQCTLDELWINSANGRHLCRVLEFGVLDPGEWMTYTDVGCFSAEDCRNLIFALLQGLCELHGQGLVHDNVAIYSLIFTSTEANTLSDHQLRGLIGNSNSTPIEKIDPSRISEIGRNLPSALVSGSNQEPFIKFKRQARLKAFPPLLKIGEAKPEPVYHLTSRPRSHFMEPQSFSAKISIRFPKLRRISGLPAV